MAVNEIESFIKKFYQLWSAGVSAHLDLDTHAGEAWVGLRVQLGPAPGPEHKHSSSPPRQCNVVLHIIVDRNEGASQPVIEQNLLLLEK